LALNVITTEVLGEKPVSIPLCPPQIADGLATEVCLKQKFLPSL